MARTLIDADNIATGSLTRSLLNTTTAASAVIAKVIAGTNISLTSTGVDAGTGDVTVNLIAAPSLATSLTLAAAGGGTLLTVGTKSSSSTTPSAITLDTSISSVEGANPKINLLGASGGFGFGVSNDTAENCLDLMVPTGSNFNFYAGGTLVAQIGGDGSLTAIAGISAGGLGALAQIQLVASTTTVPMIQVDGGSLTTSPIAGAFEADANDLYFTDSIGPTRQKLANQAWVTANTVGLASPAFTGTPTAPTAAVSTTTTQLATTAFVIGQAATAAPAIDGTAAVGTSKLYARSDHVHPTDTTRAALAGATYTGAVVLAAGATGLSPLKFQTGVNTSSAISGSMEYDGTNLYFTPGLSRRTVAFLDSPTFTGTPAAPTAAANTNTTQLASTAFVVGQVGTATPLVDGVAAVGTSLLYARQDHKHPTDTTLAPLAGATFTGAVVAAAGTTALAPLKMTSGTNLTTAAAGVFEYDGAVFYSSVAASERGVIPSTQFIMLTAPFTTTSQTAAQKIFNSPSNGTITLAVGTYEFSCQFSLTAMSATSGGFGFTLGGTATFTQAWSALCDKQPLAAPNVSYSSFNVAAASPAVMGAATTNTTGFALIQGIIRITVAGTIIPQYTQTTAAAAIIGTNSFFKISPLGASGVASVGNWS